ncbi:MAG: choline dehydrogenase [Proteobacteria bacterium]|nr:choline dehydrogenase [Pseudomonadota bacterium]
MKTQTLSADYVIVGAGSAGCVLANRLTENENCSVILLEAGGTDQRLIVKMPSAFYLPMQSKSLSWGYRSEPEAHMNGRRLDCPRGRGLGGSSSINGMVYVRGHAQDYERWQSLGAEGWSYADVLPYFKKAQGSRVGASTDVARGFDGPLTTTNGSMQNPLYGYFLQAAQQAGYAYREDLNDGEQEGFGPLPMTVGDGVRQSSSRSYLARPGKNLRILRNATVTNVVMDHHRAIGVEALVKGRRITVRADQEVILSAGAINSPQLLMLSGIGNAEHLRHVGIEALIDAPGVGENLMDHLEVYVQQVCTEPLSLYKDLSYWGRMKIGMRWLYNQSGLGATNHFEAGGFMRSDPSQPYPDIQFHFLPAAMSYDGSSKVQQHGFQAHVGPMLPRSRGSVSLRSNDPYQAPRINFNYMSEAEDWRVFREAIRAARRIFAQPALFAVSGQELSPGAEQQSDAQLDEFIRNHAESAYHPCGTCRMGNDACAVVDPTGRVNGVEKLRVVDSSIFPHIPNGNLNAPTIMLAEKLADAIKADASA